jgi:hypothetical protein
MSRPASKRPVEDNDNADDCRQAKKGVCVRVAVPTVTVTSGGLHWRLARAESTAAASLCSPGATISLCACVYESSSAKGESVAAETIQLPNGWRYVGQINGAGQPHGEGVWFAADGSEVAGQWCHGKLHGRGKRTYVNGDRYEGDFVDGRYSGLGTYTWADGRMFEGEWADGKIRGFGVLWSTEGKVLHCGRWENAKFVETRPVPRSKIPVGVRLSAAGPFPASVLRPACAVPE